MKYVGWGAEGKKQQWGRQNRFDCTLPVEGMRARPLRRHGMMRSTSVCECLRCRGESALGSRVQRRKRVKAGPTAIGCEYSALLATIAPRDTLCAI